MRKSSLIITAVIAFGCTLDVAGNEYDYFARCNTHDKPKKVIWACTKLMMDPVVSDAEKCMLTFRRAMAYIKKDKACGLHGALSDLTKVIKNKCPVVKDAHYKRAIVYHRLFHKDSSLKNRDTLQKAMVDLQIYSRLDHNRDANQLVSTRLSAINNDLIRFQQQRIAFTEPQQNSNDFSHWINSRIQK